MSYCTYQVFDEDDLYDEFISTVENSGIAFNTILTPVYHSANPYDIQSEQIKFEAFPKDFTKLDDILKTLVNNYREHLQSYYNIAEIDDVALQESLKANYKEDKIFFFLSKLELKQRGVEVGEQIEEEGIEQVINEAYEPKELSQNFVIFIYLLGLASLVAFLALGITLGLLPALYIAYKGYEVAFNKVEIPGGDYTYEYDDKTRFNGKAFLVIGILLVCLWIGVMYARVSS